MYCTVHVRHVVLPQTYLYFAPGMCISKLFLWWLYPKIDIFSFWELANKVYISNLWQLEYSLCTRRSPKWCHLHVQSNIVQRNIWCSWADFENSQVAWSLVLRQYKKVLHVPISIYYHEKIHTKCGLVQHLKKPWFCKVWTAMGSLPVWGGGGGIPRHFYSPSLLSHLEGDDWIP
jgi:hypothetical protein